MSKVYQIIESFFKQPQSENIQRDFFRWLKQSHSLQEKDEAIAQIWDNLNIQPDLSTEESYTQVATRLNFVMRKKHRETYMRLARIAALFVIPLFSFFAAWWFVRNQKSAELSLVECYAPNGKIKEIVLPDSSRVRLNSGSTLFYPRQFNTKTRDIYLSGEAKFTVAHDKTKPFIVKTNDMNVEALGTVFNVSSYPDNACTVTTLVEGKVKVDIASAGNSFILAPHEQVVFDKKTGNSMRKKARIDYVLAWEKGHMVFQGASLYTIIKEIERHYAVTAYLNTRNLQEGKITVKFLNDETLDEVLQALQLVTGCHYEIKKDKIFIY